ncbi:hypothetical protein NFI96_007901 [Prochilodus magdalenae]|nr:hypothetical protein NFI96_007901 [Prochilodus magdalenae]
MTINMSQYLVWVNLRPFGQKSSGEVGHWPGSQCWDMWGSVVVGVGIAGRVRIRDLLAPLPSSAAEMFTLRGFVSRRTLEDQPGVKQVSVEEALSRNDVQVAFVCTENSSHEEHVRRFLEAGKHVSVEYPITLDYSSAAALWDLAQQKAVYRPPDVAAWDLFGENSPFKGQRTLEENEDRKYMKLTGPQLILTQDQRPSPGFGGGGEKGTGPRQQTHPPVRFELPVTMTELPEGQKRVGGTLFPCKDIGAVRVAKLQEPWCPPEQLQAEQEPNYSTACSSRRRSGSSGQSTAT